MHAYALNAKEQVDDINSKGFLAYGMSNLRPFALTSLLFSKPGRVILIHYSKRSEVKLLGACHNSSAFRRKITLPVDHFLSIWVVPNHRKLFEGFHKHTKTFQNVQNCKTKKENIKKS